MNSKADIIAEIERLRFTIDELSLKAANFLPVAKNEATARRWLAGSPMPKDEALFNSHVKNAVMMATALALFTPNLFGTTAIDRLARNHKIAGPDETAAIEAMRNSRFRVLTFERVLPPKGFIARDIATEEMLHLIDGEIPPDAVGLSFAVRVCPVMGDYTVIVGSVTPLDEPMLNLARQFIRPEGRGLAAQRCAEVLYRHFVRHGSFPTQSLDVVIHDGTPGGTPGATPDATPGAQMTFPFKSDDGPVHHLAFALDSSSAEPTAKAVQNVREMTSADNILDALIGTLAARQLGQESLATAYETVALIQMETIERRAASGLSVSLDGVASLLSQAIANKFAPIAARDLFLNLRRRVRVSPPGPKTANVDLDKVLGRIQALREKTVDRGCTEQEALLAAAKVAEMLDRYGLSLSEVELKNQTCEGTGIETGRKRFGPIDICIPNVGRFCDCRVWSEKSAAGEIHYVFFGLPADVAGARYLYELVQQAFETETEQFRASPLYTKHHSSSRRTLTSSFQTGLAHGIAGKLHTLHTEREVNMRTTTGRDLVLVKEAVVDDELAKLGMTFKTRSGQKGIQVVGDAYDAGRVAGDKFECRAGIEQSET